MRHILRRLVPACLPGFILLASCAAQPMSLLQAKSLCLGARTGSSSAMWGSGNAGCMEVNEVCEGFFADLEQSPDRADCLSRCRAAHGARFHVAQRSGCASVLERSEALCEQYCRANHP